MKICKECAKEFESLSNRELYCSHACKRLVRNRASSLTKDKQKQYREKPDAKYKRYKMSAIKRGYSFDLSQSEFLAFWKKSCHYCGNIINTIGLDRIDNSQGYSIENVVPCCTACNIMKHTLDGEQFIKKCIAIARRFT